MIRLIILFFFLLLRISSFGDSIPANKPTMHLELDTLRFQKIEEPRKASLNDQMPWIVALAIGGLSALMNFLIARRQQQLLIKQMASSKDLAILEFTKTLNSGNRQEWINSVRENLSTFISLVKLLNIEFNEDTNLTRRKDLMEKITYRRAKLFLLLSASARKTNQASLFSAITQLFDLLDRQLYANYSKSHQADLNLEIMKKSDELINIGRQVLQEEWESIQSIKIEN